MELLNIITICILVLIIILILKSKEYFCPINNKDTKFCGDIKIENKEDENSCNGCSNCVVCEKDNKKACVEKNKETGKPLFITDCKNFEEKENKSSVNEQALLEIENRKYIPSINTRQQITSIIINEEIQKKIDELDILTKGLI